MEHVSLRRSDEVTSRGHSRCRRLCLLQQAGDASVNPLVPKGGGEAPREPLATSADVLGHPQWGADATATCWARPRMLLYILRYARRSPQQSHPDLKVNSPDVEKTLADMWNLNKWYR